MFNKLQAQNFISWKSLEFEFTSGVTLIEGYNYDDKTAEGSGKSSVINAITWCLYGQLPKDTKIDDVIKQGEKSCSVSLELNSGHIITRSRKPNDLCIRHNDVDVRGKDMKETQDMIVRLIGFSFETFCQTVYFPQNYSKKFISANEAERVKILSDIQDLEQFDRARKRAKNILDAENEAFAYDASQLALYENQLVSLNKQIHTVKSSIVQTLASSETKKLEYKVQLDKWLAAVSDLTAELLDYPNDKIDEAVNRNTQLKSQTEQLLIEKKTQLALISNENSALNALSEQASKYHNKILELEKTIEKEKSHKCSSCGGMLEKDHAEQRLSLFQADLDEVRHNMSETQKKIVAFVKKDENTLKLEISSLVDQIKSLDSEIQKLYARKTKNVQLETKKLIILKENIPQIEKSIEQCANPDVSYYESELAKLQEEYKNIQESHSLTQGLLKNRSDYISKLEELVKGFKDIKSHVFESLLKELSRKTNIYVSDLFEVPVSVKFLNKDDTGEISKIDMIVEYEGQERSLGLFSGGQYRRLQFAIDLALSDIVAKRANRPINIRILDEYFKDLSETSMEKALNLLKTLPGSTILIEHNSIFKTIVDNVFGVELRDGTSERV